MIVGVGTDTVDILRVEAAIERQGEAFVRRVLSPAERTIAASYRGGRLNEFVAGRFVAKEAIAKAIGCGLGRLVMAAVTISVTNRGLTVTAVSPSELMIALAEHAIHVSISHSATTALAFAVYERV